jgi:hypothetical protein
MKVHELRDVLEKFAKIYAEAGDDRRARGLRSFTNLLKDKGSIDVRAYLTELNRARSRSA